MQTEKRKYDEKKCEKERKIQEKRRNLKEETRRRNIRQTESITKTD